MSADGLRELVDPGVSGEPGAIERLDEPARREAGEIISGLRSEGGGNGSSSESLPPGSPADSEGTEPLAQLPDLPDLPDAVWIVIGLVALIAVLWFMVRASRPAAREARKARSAQKRAVSEFERLALEAERAGEHERAVRLYYRAGVDRLARAGVSGVSETATARQLSRSLPPDPFVTVDAVHSAVAYGTGPAGPDESRGAREQWERIEHAERG